MKNLKRVLRFFQPDAASIFLALGLLLGSTFLSLLKPWPLAVIVDSVLGSKPLPAWLAWASAWKPASLLAVLGGAIVLVHIGHGALAARQNFAAIQIGLRGLVRVRNEVFRWLEHLSLRFQQGRNQGDLIYRMSWDTYSFQTLFQQGIFTFVNASLSLVLMLLVMWGLNRPLASVAILAVPFLVLSMKFLGRGMSQRSLAAHQADSQVTSAIQQTIATLPLLQSYTREEFEEERFAARVGEAYRKRVAQHAWEVLYWLVIAIGFGLAAAGLTWLGAKQVLAGRLTIGELLVFLGYLSQLYEPLNQLSHVGSTVAEASAGTQRVLELLDTPQEVQDVPNARPVMRGMDPSNPASEPLGKPNTPPRRGLKPDDASPPQENDFPPGNDPLPVMGNITFDHVSFMYQKGQLVLDDVSFSVTAGQSVAIIGPSGAGKTTLLQLLPRFYDPDSGSVKLEGADLRQLRLKDLRAQVAWVPQEPLLLQASIAENIGYGNPGAPRSAVEEAARAAQADRFIENLPQKYDTIVGEGAARLSAGEKQRINLARAFLKNAPILVLDEPTSALDVESEELVVASLGQLMRNRTAFLVAHRLSTVRRADRILVMDRGRLVESGTPEELLRRDGYYARVVRQS